MLEIKQRSNRRSKSVAHLHATAPLLKSLLMPTLREHFTAPPYDAMLVHHVKNPYALAAIDDKACALIVHFGTGFARITPRRVRLDYVAPSDSPTDHRHVSHRRGPKGDRVALDAIRCATHQTVPRLPFLPIMEAAALAVAAINAGRTLPMFLNALCKQASARETLAVLAMWPALAEWELSDV